jgi:hypothetical protein
MNLGLKVIDKSTGWGGYKSMNPAAADMPHSQLAEAESVSIGTLAETLHGPSCLMQPGASGVERRHDFE